MPDDLGALDELAGSMYHGRKTSVDEPLDPGTECRAESGHAQYGQRGTAHFFDAFAAANSQYFEHTVQEAASDVSTFIYREEVGGVGMDWAFKWRSPSTILTLARCFFHFFFTAGGFILMLCRHDEAPPCVMYVIFADYVMVGLTCVC